MKEKKLDKRKTLEESIAAAMDCGEKGIMPFLPYILQDFWEMGSDPETIIGLVRKFTGGCDSPKVLDLGCGKGAVSVKVAAELGLECLGIDGIPEFIDYARSKAHEFKVSELCRFEVGDIREKIKGLKQYDVIILGAIGPVFGDYFETLSILKPYLKKHGILIVDDGFTEDGSEFSHPQVLKRGELLQQVSRAGMLMADEVQVIVDQGITDNHQREYDRIVKRSQELMERFPEKAGMFFDYVNKQREEYESFQFDIICSTMVFKKKGSQ